MELIPGIASPRAESSILPLDNDLVVGMLSSKLFEMFDVPRIFYFAKARLPRLSGVVNR